MKSELIDVKGIKLSVVDVGSGPAVLLIHGFPDTSQVWRYQIPALVKAGYRVIAPDVRGFGNSDKPQEIQAYDLTVLVGDMINLMSQLGIEKAHVVGHDMGSAIAWVMASFFPQRVNRLASLSVGHPMANRERKSIEQREKAWYMLLFQFKGTAESLLQQDDWKLFREILRNHSEFANWTKDLSRPGALTAALNWYRANLSPEKELTQPVPIPVTSVPSLGIWSSGDPYLTEKPMLATEAYVTGGWRYERIEGAGHWVQLDAADQVNGLLIDFFSKSK
ncbi:MAG TPA: alpha/beta hydrolase [Smithellaceae bacterium]|nr:alpha/beta hydrolase [Smithellaceae bacterium]